CDTSWRRTPNCSSDAAGHSSHVSRAKRSERSSRATRPETQGLQLQRLLVESRLLQYAMRDRHCFLEHNLPKQRLDTLSMSSRRPGVRTAISSKRCWSGTTSNMSATTSKRTLERAPSCEEGMSPEG